MMRTAALGLLVVACAAAGTVHGRPAPSEAAPGERAAPSGEAHARVGTPAPGTNAGILTVGRLRYGGGGDWYANPSSLPNLLRAIRTETGFDVAEREVVVTPLDPGLAELTFVHMTGHGEVVFTPEERLALRRWLEDGGFLHADDNYGMDTAFRREIGLLFPDRELVAVPPEHPVYRIVHDFPDGLPKIHEHDGEPPGGYGIFLDGRLAVFYSHETDLGNGWEDAEVHGLPAALREAALRMGVNLFVYALTRRAP
jgi:hypothetical protein